MTKQKTRNTGARKGDNSSKVQPVVALLAGVVPLKKQSIVQHDYFDIHFSS